MKSCKKCNGVDFYPSGNCKPCHIAVVRRYQERNKEKVRERVAKYRAENKDKVHANDAIYRSKSENIARKKYLTQKRYSENREEIVSAVHKWKLDNPEKVKETNRLWREKNKEYDRKRHQLYKANNREKVNKSARMWREANPEASRIIDQNRRARKKAFGGKISKGLIEKLYKLQRGLCACCGKKLENNYHLDHIMPLALGGAHSDHNMQLLTARCNLRKNAKHPVEYMQEQGFLL